MKSVAIAELLNGRGVSSGSGSGVSSGVNSEGGGGSVSVDSKCDVAYLLFLEPPLEPDPNNTALESCIDTAIRMFQPLPVLAHCELLVPPVPSCDPRIQFATYIGQSSAWQLKNADGKTYYLNQNIGRWRAVPVFGKDITEKMRSECDAEIGVSYSLARYVTSAAPMRFFASLMPDKRRSPAHCATLTARVINHAAPNILKHSSAWYSPSSLYLDASSACRERAMDLGITDTSHKVPQHTSEAIDKLLRGAMTSANVSSLGNEACMDATRALTVRVCKDLISGDATAQRLSQRQLASALLRWVHFG
jgi:hypothetical protein